jgi:hypothetical protein
MIANCRKRPHGSDKTLAKQVEFYQMTFLQFKARYRTIDNVTVRRQSTASAKTVGGESRMQNTSMTAF